MGRRTHPPRALLACTVAAALAAAASGCGLGAGPKASNTQLTVSKDFGAEPIVQTDQPKTGGSDTVMRLLERNAPKVQTRYGGSFVQSIDGVSGGRKDGDPYDWFFYVNGILSDKGATSVQVHAGDRVWWDWHDWSATDDVPAVVGSFPEPFLHGVNGKRLPTRVECAVPKSAACSTVAGKIQDLGLVAARGGVGNSFVEDTLRIIVGPWRAVGADNTAMLIGQGPAKSGVYAKPAADGKSIALLDQKGQVAKTLGAGTGLIAATEVRDKKEQVSDPVWVVTGTDEAGVDAAAAALDEGALAGRFAVAVSGGKPIGLPYREGS
ncbi:MAG TPA: DUF4430 domain-containing protein [Baekduia sp.]|uniref:DUF4430 domain-containing protein n=1 Tax=Baekduia sp. TaxID=2600305 RepID=UPI002D79F36D|nr:DUF4430 domain-containing protein [Baekduia sp.]HET6506018.1 DUF4430 domain-containing protein [Baekduia sp.]